VIAIILAESNDGEWLHLSISEEGKEIKGWFRSRNWKEISRNEVMN
jgi:hypothetical protein